MFFSPGVLEEGSSGRRPTTNGGQIKATPKTNINQLAGNRQKDIKKTGREASKSDTNSLRRRRKGWLKVRLSERGGVQAHNSGD